MGPRQECLRMRPTGLPFVVFLILRTSSTAWCTDLFPLYIEFPHN